MYYILGILLVIVAAVLQAYCEFNQQARENIKHKIFKTEFRYVLEALWILLLGAGSVILFFFGIAGTGWIWAVIAIVMFWLVLPFIITPIMRNRLLPPWDEVKTELGTKGYNERNYWRGDWWMDESKRKKKKEKR